MDPKPVSNLCGPILTSCVLSCHSVTVLHQQPAIQTSPPRQPQGHYQNRDRNTITYVAAPIANTKPKTITALSPASSASSFDAQTVTVTSPIASLSIIVLLLPLGFLTIVA